ncbi:heavy metal translocating P-type ATPase [Amaricoccus solimangrovi]|uniref:Cadmium-translocating P-type ATPase n=1 Tax=Amaricoccus solimangrovi TaxID=2589815 RepID=A0A501WN13_9RHOB|nr:heavy metal translocating P-type ATPase [Amaricoccus solimangrovi]TPE50708.1 cadmium-translocating P-type ATPase [Amaricoccus solimangrovi]
MAEAALGMACPACAAAPDPEVAARARPEATPRQRRVELSLPAIHCAACISGVERALLSDASVLAARVNLTRKRVNVTVADAPEAEERLIALLRARGFEARPLDGARLAGTRADPEGRALLARIGVAGFASMNVMLLSVAVWSGATDATRDLMHWLSALITLPAVAFAATPFFRSAGRALLAGRMNMDVPISTAIILAAAVSLSETILSGRQAFFEAAIMLTFFLLVGRYLAHAARLSARSAAAELAALEVRRAERRRPDGTIETVPVDALRAGEEIVVVPGGRVPVDGQVTEGRSELDCSMLTGETLPRAVSPGDTVHAGMVNLTGALRVRIVGLGEETLLRRITHLVEAAELARGSCATLADRAARAYAPLVNLLGLGALAYWGLTSGDWRSAFNIAAAVMIVTCPCGLGLAVPTVQTAASARLFRRGVLLKDGTALEKLARIDTVIFDKTGTLTTGNPVLLEPEAIDPGTLALAAGLARFSRHPLARAIERAALAAEVPAAPVTEVEEVPGLGIRGRTREGEVRLGRGAWVGTGAENAAETISWLRLGSQAPIALRFTDEPRPDARETVAGFRDEGMHVALLSGDGEGAVGQLAAHVGIDLWYAGATPIDKSAYLRGMHDEGHRGLMIGDGLNDAAALAIADVSITPASAVDASRASADIVLMSNRLADAVVAWRMSRVARRRMIENIAFSFGYNLITVPIAFMGHVSPLIAAIAMSASSIVVSLNALRLARGDVR